VGIGIGGRWSFGVGGFDGSIGLGSGAGISVIDPETTTTTTTTTSSLPFSLRSSSPAP
jgi:hypothetical protein